MTANKSPGGFKALIVWQKAQELATEVVAELERLPRNRQSEAIGLQLLRSAGSVAANIAEGYGRYSAGAYRNHLSIARGSLFETESWIDLLSRTGYVSEETSSTMTAKCVEVGRLLTAMMRALPRVPARRMSDEGATYTSLKKQIV
ncbi:MAG TPA: four helix bundle protein [Dehalococcoidia bacterium]|nr:four helix bundle protein [Dehalococcoidia bacterium]